MHKKIKAELVSLAHSILEMKNKKDVGELHKRAGDIYEKLSVLKFVDSYINESQNSEESEEEKAEILTEEQVKDVFGEDTMLKDDKNEIPLFQNSFEEELKDAISADVATELFESVTKESPVIEEVTESKQRSLNDALYKSNLQVGLNDRIAFVKHLFEGNQEDFNRVLSQLNSFKNENEAKDFINTMVKPDYDWSEKQDYEERLMNIIERKFL